MLVGTRQWLKISSQLNVQIENIHLQNVTEQIATWYFDEHLTWSSHIDHLCSILASKISLLRQLSKYVSTDYQKMFYQGLCLSVAGPTVAQPEVFFNSDYL